MQMIILKCGAVCSKTNNNKKNCCVCRKQKGSNLLGKGGNLTPFSLSHVRLSVTHGGGFPLALSG